MWYSTHKVEGRTGAWELRCPVAESPVAHLTLWKQRSEKWNHPPARGLPVRGQGKDFLQVKSKISHRLGCLKFLVPQFPQRYSKGEGKKRPVFISSVFHKGGKNILNPPPIYFLRGRKLLPLGKADGVWCSMTVAETSFLTQLHGQRCPLTDLSS